MILQLLLSFLCTLYTLDAKIVEHHHISCLHEYIEPSIDTLIIFDIDNTLIEPVGWIGGPTWFEHIVKEKMRQERVSFAQAELAIVKLLAHVISHVTYVPVEHTIAALIKQLQNHNHAMIALTSRSTVLAELTHKALTNVDIQFAHSTFISPTIHSHDIYYHYHGIVFCDGGCKGTVLVTLLAEHNYRPKRIICIDDSARHLHAIEKALATMYPDIEFIGIRYSHLDHKCLLFDPVIAQQELETLLIATA